MGFLIDALQLERHLGSPSEQDNLFSIATRLVKDEQEEYPSEEVSMLNRWGLNKHYVPISYGGALSHWLSLGYLVHVIAQRDLSVALAHHSTFLAFVMCLVESDKEQLSWFARKVLEQETFCLGLSEREHGADILASEASGHSVAGRAQATGGKWLINNASRADVLFTFLRTEDDIDPRSFSMVALNKQAFGVESLQCDAKIPTHGVKGIDLSGFQLKDAEYTEKQVIGCSGSGFSSALRGLQVTRMFCAWLALGVAQTALELALAFSLRRTLYAQKLWDIPYIRSALVDAYVDIRVCEAISIRSMQTLQHAPEEAGIYSSVVKAFVPEILLGTVTRLCELVGARSYLRGIAPFSMLEKCRRDITLIPIFDGSTAVNYFNVIVNLRILGRLSKEPNISYLDGLECCCNLDSTAPEITLEDLTIDYSTVEQIGALVDMLERHNGQGMQGISGQLESLRTKGLHAVRQLSNEKVDRARGVNMLTKGTMEQAKGYVESFVLTNCVALDLVNRDFAGRDILTQDWLYYALDRYLNRKDVDFNKRDEWTQNLSSELLDQHQRNNLFSLFRFELASRYYPDTEGV
jgi:alkylation response protein AidB-like acyl-CoA dehydrogenase